jgi:hypothetical protein
MSHDSELNFRKMQENNPTSKENNAESISNYAAPGNVRNITFIWQDGKKHSLNYSYLVSCEYLPDENTINLLFTTHTVILKGVKLSGLFDALVAQLPEVIACVDARYNAMVEGKMSVVNEISIEMN